MGVRIPLAVPATLRWRTRSGKGQKAVASTVNISGNGILLRMARRLGNQTTIDCEIPLPGRFPVLLVCRVRIVRRTEPGEAPGVAAVIDDYTLRPSSPAA